MNSAQTKQYDLNVTLSMNNWTEMKDVFSQSYRLALRDTFAEGSAYANDHDFKNHVKAFVEQLKLNCIQLTSRPYNKRQIYVVNYGMNTWSEINWERPSIIYKTHHSAQGEDIVVIPLTSALKQKLTDKYDMFVQKDDVNNLYQSSYARIRQMRSVSLKRIGKHVWAITRTELMDAIDHTVEKMLDLKRSAMHVEGVAE